MIIFRNNFKCLSRLNLNFSLISTQAFRFSSDPHQENQEKPKIQPKILQKIRKMDLKKHLEKTENQEKIEKNDKVEPSQEKGLVETTNAVELASKSSKRSKSNKAQGGKKKESEPATGEVKQYFLNTMNQEELDHKTFSIAKLMDYNSTERKSKIKHFETTLMLNKEMVQRMSKTELNKKMSDIKEELVRELPKNLYRLGMSSQEMSKHTPLVKQAMGLHNASINEMRKARILEIRSRFAKHERDTANPAITASVLCENVIHLLNHIKQHKKDMSAFIKLKEFLTKRRKYLRYLKRKDFQGYAFIVKYYGIKDIEDANAKSFKRMLRI